MVENLKPSQAWLSHIQNLTIVEQIGLWILSVHCFPGLALIQAPRQICVTWNLGQIQIFTQAFVKNASIDFHKEFTVA